MRAWAGFLRQQTSRWRSGARCFQSTFRGYALSVAERAKSSEVKTREAVGGRKKVSHRALSDRLSCGDADVYADAWPAFCGRVAAPNAAAGLLPASFLNVGYYDK